MPSARPDSAEIYRRRRVAAGIGLLLVLLLVFFGLRAIFAGGGKGNGEDRAEGPSQAARSWALDQRIRKADRANREAISSALAITPVLRHGSGGKPQVALTFDDGPSQYTPEILDLLDKYEAKATFFVIGGASDAHAELIQDEVARGHVVANHTVGHEALSSLEKGQQAAQIDGQTRAIKMFGAPKPHLFRPPYNAWNETTLEILDRRKMLMVLWSVETNDWKKPGVEQIVDQTLSAVEPGSIVLFHDGGGDRTQTVEALPRIIESLQADGYELVTIPQLLRDSPPTDNQR